MWRLRESVELGYRRAFILTERFNGRWAGARSSPSGSPRAGTTRPRPVMLGRRVREELEGAAPRIDAGLRVVPRAPSLMIEIAVEPLDGQPDVAHRGRPVRHVDEVSRALVFEVPIRERMAMRLEPPEGDVGQI